MLWSRVSEATSAWGRLRGLLGRPSLDPDQGLWIAPCRMVHTVGMRFAIDALFLDRAGQVVGICRELTPGRVGRFFPRAHSVLEVAAGSAAVHGLALGDRLRMER